MAKVISQLPSGGSVPKHNNLLGLNEGDYLHLTQFEKAKLDGIQSGAEVNVNTDWNAVSGDAQLLNKPSTFPPSAHTHLISEVVNLENELNGKASTNTLDYLQLNKEDKDNKSTSIFVDYLSNIKFPSVKAVYDWAVAKFRTWVLSINTITGTTYTVGLNDYKTKNIFTSATAVTFTVPTNASAAVTIGTYFSYTVQGDGCVKVNGSGVTFVGYNFTFSKGDTFSLEKIAQKIPVIPTIINGKQTTIFGNSEGPAYRIAKRINQAMIKTKTNKHTMTPISFLILL